MSFLNSQHNVPSLTCTSVPNFHTRAAVASERGRQTGYTVTPIYFEPFWAIYTVLFKTPTSPTYIPHTANHSTRHCNVYCRQNQWCLEAAGREDISGRDQQWPELHLTYLKVPPRLTALLRHVSQLPVTIGERWGPGGTKYSRQWVLGQVWGNCCDGGNAAVWRTTSSCTDAPLCLKVVFATAPLLSIFFLLLYYGSFSFFLQSY